MTKRRERTRKWKGVVEWKKITNSDDEDAKEKKTETELRFNQLRLRISKSSVT